MKKFKKKKDEKYQYKINTSLLYGFMKDRTLSLLLTKADISEAYKELSILLQEHLVPIRPNRSNESKYRNRIVPKN